MFVGIGLNLVRGGGSASPASLFAASEPGAWYDPSDLTTVFQNNNGTTPVTAAGQTVGLILDKSQGLTLGPELVSNGTFDTNITGWTNGYPTRGRSEWISGTLRVTNDSSLGSATGFSEAYAAITTVVGKTYFVSIGTMSGNSPRVEIGPSQFGSFIFIRTSAGKGYFVATSTTTYIAAEVYTATNAAFATFDNISVKLVNGNHAFQATTASRPTYQIDANGKPYLSFDGVDDGLATSTITPGTDKAQVFAGVRKLSDATQSIVAEMSATIVSNAGSLALTAPNSAAANYNFSSKGVLQTDNTVVTYTSPITNVLTGLGDIGGSSNIIRVNGAQAGSNLTTQGIGNYLSYPLYIGRRGGTTLPANMRLYSLILRFGANLTDGQITSTESWVNGKTGAF